MISCLLALVIVDVVPSNGLSIRRNRDTDIATHTNAILTAVAHLEPRIIPASGFGRTLPPVERTAPISQLTVGRGEIVRRGAVAAPQRGLEFR